MSHRVHIGVFAHEKHLLSAIAELRRHDLHIVDAYMPYPVHGIEEAMGIRRSRLPIVCFLAGLIGVLGGLALQYWTSAVNWPLNVGGKPLDSLPAFIPVVFELMILCAGLATAFALLFRSTLFPGKQVRPVAAGLTDDRFAVVVAPRDASVPDDAIVRIWDSTGAVEHREELVGP